MGQDHPTSLPAGQMPATPDNLRELVLSVVKGDTDHQRFMEFLEPVAQKPGAPQGDTALTLALLLEEVEKHGELNDKVYELAEDPGPPVLMLRDNGRIVAHNPAAQTLYNAREGDSISRLGVSKAEFSGFCERIHACRGPSLLRTFPLTTDDNPLPVILMGLYEERHHMYLLRAIECQWPESIDLALREVFRLTEAECDILARMAQGMNSDQIARQRSRSVGTVRQQIKTLLSKLGATSQVQATALASAIGGQALAGQRADAPLSSDDHYPADFNVLMVNNRQLAWRRYGHPGGHPVLMFHGAYFGAGDFWQDRQWAADNRLDVVAIERLGYGQSQPAEQNEDAPDLQLQDLDTLLEQLQWQQFTLMSQDFGFVPALLYANRHPENIQGLLAVSPPSPMADMDNLEHVPRQQRIYLWAARHAFWMIRLLLRLGHVKARHYGPERWMEMVFDGAPHDLSVFRAPDFQQGAAASYFYNLKQKSKGHETDLYLTIAMDWMPLLRQLNIPLIALAGDRNDTFPLEKVRQLPSLCPAMELQEISSAGMTLSLTHADACSQSIQRLLHQNVRTQ